MSLISLWWYNIIGYQRAINWFKSLIPSTNNITPEFRTLNNTLPLVVVAVKLFGAPRVFWSRTPLLGKTGFFGTFYVMNDHLVWAQTCAVDIFNVIYIYIIYIDIFGYLHYIWDIPIYLYKCILPLPQIWSLLHPVPIDRSSVHPPPLAVQFRQEMWRG